MSDQKWTGPTKAAEGMHPDLRWLAENVSEWKHGHHMLAKRIDSDGCKFETLQNANYEQHHDYYGKRFDYAQWLQARKDLGLDYATPEQEADWHKEEPWAESVPEGVIKYSPYFKDVSHIDKLDVYRVIDLFGCEKHGHPIGHAVKKLLLSGVRTGGKDVEKDVDEAIDTLLRWKEMREEDKARD